VQGEQQAATWWGVVTRQAGQFLGETLKAKIDAQGIGILLK
jgi:hypothetical protein